MFLTIQYPITDLRILLGNANKLKRPAWPNPDIDSELRHFGAIGSRTKGGILQWPAEEKFCISNNAINLKELTQQKVTFSNKDLRFEGSFRRFFKPGAFTCKYEIALTHPIDYVINKCSQHELMSGVYDDAMKTIIGCFLKLNIKVENTKTKASEEKIKKAGKKFIELQLHQAGSKLAELYLKGSTKGPFFKATENWWVVPGEPLALISYIDTGKIKLPANAVLVEDITEHGILLHSVMYPIAKNRFIRCWIIGLDTGKKSRESVTFLRQLRINLFRINAEKESLRHVLNTISANNFLLEDQDARVTLSNFLEDATSKLLKKVRFGIEQDKILYYALHSEELAKPGSLETLLSQLKPLENKFVLKNVEKLAPPEIKVIKIFIASSAEVKKERDKCILVINKVKKSFKHLYLEPVRWENDIAYANYPGKKNIQEAIDPKLEESHLGIFIFYSKIGKHTREEYDYAIAHKKRVSIFFKKGFKPSAENSAGYNVLQEFKKSIDDTNLFREYKGLKEFDSFLTDNLHLLLSEEYPRQDMVTPHGTNIS